MEVPGTILPRQSAEQVNSTISVDFENPIWDIENLYLMPVTVSNPAVSFRTKLSNHLSTSWFPLAAACTLNETTCVANQPCYKWYEYLENCEEGQILDPEKSTTMKQTADSSFRVPTDAEYADQWGEFYQSKGVSGTDTMTIGGVDIPDVEMNFATAANASHAHIGLGKGSTLLDKLVEQGTIAARAFSLFVGSDVKYTQDWDPDAKDGDYPGSIVLGGLDFAKQGTDFIRGDLDSDGIPKLEVTGINVHDEHAVYQIMNQLGAPSYTAEIDVASPWVYVPQVAAEAIRAKRDNSWNDSGDLTSKTVHKGNITMVVRLNGSPSGGMGSREINITMPESVWAWDRSYSVRATSWKNRYFPFLINRSSTRSRVILGRPFLKAVYLAINYDSNQFQIAQASYSSDSNIQAFKAVAADGSNKNGSFPTLAAVPGSTGTTSATSTAIPDSSDSSSSTSTGAIAGGVVGGIFGLLAIAGIIFLLMRRRSRKKSRAQNSEAGQPTPSAGAAAAVYQQQPENYFKAELPADGYAGQQYGPPGELEASPTENKQAFYPESVNVEPSEMPASPVVPGAFVHVPLAVPPGQESYELP